MEQIDKLTRQEKLLGQEGNRKIRETMLGIVGLSGNGSSMAMAAACSGFQHFKLFDCKKLKKVNLNRFICGGPAHLGRFKVDLVRDYMRFLDPSIQCEAFRLNVQHPLAMEELKKCDFLLACPDNDQARIFLAEFCLKANIPLIEVGSGVIMNNRKLQMLGSKMSFSKPGAACLKCISLDDEPLPQSHQSFLGINLVAVGVALTTLVGYVTGMWPTKNFVSYDAINQEMIALEVERTPECSVCGYQDKVDNIG